MGNVFVSTAYLKVGISLEPGMLQAHVHGVIPQSFIVGTHINDTWQDPCWVKASRRAVHI